MASRILFLSIVMLFGCSVSAQKAFYIRPRAMMKSVNSYHSQRFRLENGQQFNNAHNGFYTFYNYGLHFTNTKLNLGISAGVKFNEKSSLELVISADGSSTKQEFIYIDQSNSVGQNLTVGRVNSIGLLWGHDFNRIGLEYHSKWLDKKRYDIRGQCGLGMFIPSLAHDAEYLYSGFGNNDFQADVEKINMVISKYAAYLQVGIGFDWKTKRGVPILSFDVFATYNWRRIMQQVDYNVTLIESDGTAHLFYHTLFSRGSGINFQLSRPIQVYPWRPYKREKSIGL